MKFELNDQILAIIGAGLGELPYKTAAPAVAELQRQINEQQPKTADQPPVEDDDEPETSHRS